MARTKAHATKPWRGKEERRGRRKGKPYLDQTRKKSVEAKTQTMEHGQTVRESTAGDSGKEEKRRGNGRCRCNTNPADHPADAN